MLAFNIDGYKVKNKHLVFSDKDIAIDYLKSHPEDFDAIIQIKSPNNFNNGFYTVVSRRNKIILEETDLNSSGESFQSIFGTRLSNRKCIQNKILLNFWKTRFPLECKKYHTLCCPSSTINTMPKLYDLVVNQLNRSGNNWNKSTVNIAINKDIYRFPSNLYEGSVELTSSEAIDPKCVKVIDLKASAKTGTNKIISIKVSKIILNAIKTSKCIIGPSAETWIAEEFQAKYESYKAKELARYKLVVDKDFAAIYSSSRCTSSFGSCMCGKKKYSFYSHFDCNAAYLIDTQASGSCNIAARCILFNNVYQCSDPNTPYRYIERQYAENDKLKHLLVAKLLDTYPDIIGFKTIGAGASDSRNIMNRNKVTMKDSRLFTKIIKPINSDTLISYQDTFKEYYYRNEIAANYGYSDSAYVSLGTTADHVSINR